MRIALALFILLHGAIHLMGFVKAFGIAEIAQLQQPIGPRAGVLWGVAAVLLMAGGVILLTGARWWWIPTLAGVALSQLLIFGAWSDARFGTVANVIILLPLLLAMAELRGGSLPSRYAGAVEARMAEARMVNPGDVASLARPLIVEADLEPLPPAVARWLRRVGVVGRPRVRSLYVRFQAEIRGGAEERWMRGTAEQFSFLDPPERLFTMDVTRAGLPVDVYHRFTGEGATMQARLLGVVPVLDATGPELAQSETVTFLNDMVLLAPGALLDAGVSWEAADPRQARVGWEHGGHRVEAVLHFDEAGDLVDFHSHDRYQTDGTAHTLARWSTPVLEFGDFDGIRLPREAEAHWGEEGESWSYARFVVEEVRYNVRDGREPRERRERWER